MHEDKDQNKLIGLYIIQLSNIPKMGFICKYSRSYMAFTEQKFIVRFSLSYAFEVTVSFIRECFKFFKVI